MNNSAFWWSLYRMLTCINTITVNQDKMNTNKYLLTILAALTSTMLFAQGPWSPGKGHGYAQLLYNTVPSYTSLFGGDNGSRQTERILSETDIALYTEVGLSSQLTLGATLPIISVSSGDRNPRLSEIPLLPADNLTSLGNVSLFGKYNLINKTWNVAVIT